MGAIANVQASGYRVPGLSSPTARQRPSTARQRPPTAGFTLVEMLVVIVIISILAGLTTTAAIIVKNRAKRAMVRQEIAQLELALTHYKQEVGEFPPDFANLRSTNTAAADEARAAVVRHLRKRFPRYQPGYIRTGNLYTTNNDLFNAFVGDVTANYSGANAANFDASSALVFWLGGLPEGSSGKPAGFHSDPQFPFKQGLPRTEPMFNFDIARVNLNSAAPLGFSANTDPATPPYVYFRALRPPHASLIQYEYGYFPPTTSGTTTTYPTFSPLSYPAEGVTPSNNWGRATPYLDGTIPGDPTLPATARVWRNQETFQIIFAGFDGIFGNNDGNFRFSKLGQFISPSDGTTTVQMNASNGEEANFDNITNFTTDTIEKEMQQ